MAVDDLAAEVDALPFKFVDYKLAREVVADLAGESGPQAHARANGKRRADGAAAVTFHRERVDLLVGRGQPLNDRDHVHRGAAHAYDVELLAAGRRPGKPHAVSSLFYEGIIIERPRRDKGPIEPNLPLTLTRRGGKINPQKT